MDLTTHLCRDVKLTTVIGLFSIGKIAALSPNRIILTLEI